MQLKRVMHLRRFFSLVFVLGAWACGRTPAPSARSLAEGFNVVVGGGTPESFQRHARVTRNGRQEDAMVLVAPVTVRASVGAADGKLALRLLATPVFNIGDGMSLDVFVESKGERSRIFSRYFDAGRKAEDRAWMPLEVPVDLQGQADFRLEFELSGGPQGDLVADWLALADLRIVPGTLPRK